MRSATLLPLVAGFAAAAPASSLVERASTTCDQWGSFTGGSYTLYNNLWGASSGSGKQCTTLNTVSGNTISWSTSWTWSGGPSSVKSYANVVLKFTAKKLSAISSIPSTWQWSYSGSSIVADVAYDLFTASSCSSTTAEYEIMIWLDALGGAGPISSTGQPVATPTINGVPWKLYKGPNGSMTVFSFIAPSAQKNFKADLHDFVAYLTKNQGLPTNQCLYSIGAGTEPFLGSNAVLNTQTYSVSVN